MTQETSESAPRRSPVQVQFDRAAAALSKLNPDDLDAFVAHLRARKPRTAEILAAAFRPMISPNVSGPL